ncbi:MAG: hypothetical protein WCF16_02465 [Alphaproteobacteria bacterium]
MASWLTQTTTIADFRKEKDAATERMSIVLAALEMADVPVDRLTRDALCDLGTEVARILDLKAVESEA